MSFRRLSRAGMSVTELLVVIAIISTLMALLIPAVQWARERGRMTTCSANLKQIGYAFTQHNTDHSRYPNAGMFDPNDPSPRWSFAETETVTVPGGLTQPYVAWGWAYQILPYMSQRMLYDQLQLSFLNGTPERVQVRLEAAAFPVREYFCPTRRAPSAQDGVGCGLADGLRGGIDYAGNGGYRNRLAGVRYDRAMHAYPALESAVHPDGAVIPVGFLNASSVFQWERERVGQGALADGAASVILVGERNFNTLLKQFSLEQQDEDNGFMAGYTGDTIRWAYDVPYRDREGGPMPPPAYPAAPLPPETRFGSSHTQGCYFVFADGSVKLLKYNINLDVFRQLASRDDGNSPAVP